MRRKVPGSWYKRHSRVPLNCLTSEVVGKPEIVEKNEAKAKVRIKVRFQADLNAYDAFAARLQETLKGIAKRQGEMSATAESNAGREFVLQARQPVPIEAGSYSLRLCVRSWTKRRL